MARIISAVHNLSDSIRISADAGSQSLYMMYGCVKQNMTLAIEHMILLVETCLMIVFGFLLVDIVSRIVMRILGQEYHIGKIQ